MRKMFSRNEIIELIRKNPEAVLKALLGQDINVNGITSKGIANTGGLANIGDVAITGDLTAKSLKQSEANKVFEININSRAGVEFTKRYCKALLINNILYICASFTAKNISDSPITLSSLELQFDVDEDTGSKIICVDGSNVNDTETSNVNIGALTSYYGENFTNANPRKIIKLLRNKISFFTGAPTLQAGATEQFFARQYLILL